MTKQEAQTIAQQVYDSVWEGIAEVKIVPEHTIEKKYGWIFFAKPVVCPRHPLLGNVPTLVTKTGKIIHIPNQIRLEEAISKYEAGLPFFANWKADGPPNS
jgi:hypothetical protein